MQPNPNGELVVCCRCRKHVTFTQEALCSFCRSEPKR